MDSEGSYATLGGMSWWVGVEIDTGSAEPVGICDRNVTYNYSPLFYKVFDHPEGLRGLNGALCSEAAGVLVRAVERARALPPDEARALIRGDGSWGTPDGALEALEWLAQQAQAHPRASIYVH